MGWWWGGGSLCKGWLSWAATRPTQPHVLVLHPQGMVDPHNSVTRITFPTEGGQLKHVRLQHPDPRAQCWAWRPLGWASPGLLLALACSATLASTLRLPATLRLARLDNLLRVCCVLRLGPFVACRLSLYEAKVSRPWGDTVGKPFTLPTPTLGGVMGPRGGGVYIFRACAYGCAYGGSCWRLKGRLLRL